MTEPSTLSTALSAFDAALETGRVAQGYVVVGSVRDEGLPFATRILGRLFCKGMVKPCGECGSCVHIRDRKHVDVVWIEPEMKSRVVGIDRIRDLQQLVYRTSYEGGWKAVVLAWADRLGEEASNAFLKTLEEPPPRCLFLLLTEAPQAIMTTILSRCQRIVLSTEPERLPEPWCTELLTILATPMEDGFIGRLARGARLDALLGRIKKQVEQDETARFKEEQEAMRNPDDRKSKGDSDVLDARIQARFRELRAMVLRVMLCWYRDLMVMACGGGDAPLRFPEYAEAISAQAGRVGYAGALANIRVVEGMQRQFDRNLTADIVIPGAMSALAV